MENETNDEMYGESLLAEHVALITQGELDDLKTDLHFLFTDADFYRLHDEAFTAERVRREDVYAPLERRWVAATSALEAGTGFRDELENEVNQILEEVSVLKAEWKPFALGQLGTEILRTIYDGADLAAVPPDARRTILTLFDEVLRHYLESTGLEPFEPEDPIQTDTTGLDPWEPEKFIHRDLDD